MSIVLTVIVIFALAIFGPHIPYPEPLEQSTVQTNQSASGSVQIEGGLGEILNMSWEYKGVD